MYRHAKGWLRQTLLYVVSIACVLGMIFPTAALAEGTPPAPDGQLVESAPQPELFEAPPAIEAPDDVPAELSGEAFTNCPAPTVGEFTMIRDLEIAAAYRQSGGANAIQGYDVTPSTATTVKWRNPVFTSSSADWSNATTADFNGDGKRSVVGVYRNSGDHLALRVYRPNNEPSSYLDPIPGLPEAFAWDAGDGTRHHHCQWLDAAAGLLNRRADKKEQLVYAFRNGNGDLEMFTLYGPGGADDSIMSPGTCWRQWSPQSINGRADVYNVSVAVGDLNGDRYNDEMVTAFKDDYNHLQVLVTRVDRSGIWQEIAYMSFATLDRDNVARYGENRGIDVTTGDVDGDKKDEIIVAFADKQNKLQLLVLQLDGSTWNGSSYTAGALVDDNTFKVHDPRQVFGTDYTAGVYFPGSIILYQISVATADLDLDGKEEIALGYNSEYFAPFVLLTYDADQSGSTGIVERQRWYSLNHAEYHSPANMAYRLIMSTIAAGDVNRDGNNELVVLFRMDDGDHTWAKLLIFDGAPLSVLTKVEYGTDVISNDAVVVLGDFDGNNVRATYAGVCKQYDRTELNTVVYLPPFWWDYNAEYSSASFGKSQATSVTDAESSSTSYGGSITFDGSATVTSAVEVGPSAKVEFEYTTGTTTSVGKSAAVGAGKTVYPGDDLSSGTGALGEAFYDAVTYRLYKYIETLNGSEVWLRVPQGIGSDEMIVSAWNDSATGGGQQLYPNSWVPLGLKTNLAKGKTATQISTAYSGAASRAVDGNTDGTYNNGSVTHTGGAANPWWQVDLGQTCYIDAVDVWNRTDGFVSRLTNWVVIVTGADGTTWTSPVQTAQAGSPTTVPVGRTGRYVKVQIQSATATYLHMAEVQVWGNEGTAPAIRPVEPNQFPLDVRPILKSDGKPRTDLFEIQTRDGVWRQVKGALQWDWRKGYIDPDSDMPALARPLQQPRKVWPGNGGDFWNMNSDSVFGQEWSDEYAFTAGVGFEFKAFGMGIEVEATTGFSEGTTNGIEWTDSTFFEGQVSGLPWDTQNPDLMNKGFTYSPYMYVARGISANGIEQAYLVCDYIVPYIGPRLAAPEWDDAPLAAPLTDDAVTPAAPVLASPSHPDPANWYDSNALTFTWAQPEGDTATVAGYRWFLDDQPDTIPSEGVSVLTTTVTFPKVQDGQLYLHLRAEGANGEWSETAHRQVRVDAKPPEVKITLDPAIPTGQNGWYVTPITAAVTVTETGSGLQAVEYSTDGVNWQPYAAPLAFSADQNIALAVRAADNAGRMTTATTPIKVDRTPPSSKIILGEQTIGVWQAGVITDTLGAHHLSLAGVIQDAMSGRSGMSIGVDDADWTAATALGAWHPFPDMPEVETNWIFTATTTVGRGNHLFYGSARDLAGNAEEPYQIAQVIWFPLTTPELDGSSITVSPAAVRAGEEVTVTVSLRNGGKQEAWTEAVVTLPQGMTVITDSLRSLAEGAVVTGEGPQTITWPEVLLWPGKELQIPFQVKVDEGLGYVKLQPTVSAHTYWPNTDSLPAFQREVFTAKETSFSGSATLDVKPFVAGADLTAPTAVLAILNGQLLTGQMVQLAISAEGDANLMDLREWTLDKMGNWVVAQDSGWLPYTTTYTWTLTADAGVHYLGVWVADKAGNVSTLTEQSLQFTNLLGLNAELGAGERDQYRANLRSGESLKLWLTVSYGSAKLYSWQPGSASGPNQQSAPTSPNRDDLTVSSREGEGVYLCEVVSAGDTVYTLSLDPNSALASPAEGVALLVVQTPPQPLTVNNPLSAGLDTAPDLPVLVLPLLFKR